MDIRSIPEQSVIRVQCIGNRSSLGGRLVITHKSGAKYISESRGTGESGSDPVEL